jgi:indole-3-acetate O-methyltransferase
MFEES